MRKKWIPVVVIALSLLGSNFAYAKPGPDYHRGPGHPPAVHKKHSPERRHSPDLRQPDHRPRAYQPPRNTRPPHRYNHYNFSQYRRTPHGELRPGHAIPKYYDNRLHDVIDWRRHNLYPPAKGYRWIRVQDDFLLVAVASGIITHILIGH